MMETPASQVNTISRLPRLILRRVAYGLIVLGQIIKPRIGVVLLVSVLLGIIAFQAIALIAPLFVRQASDSRVALIQPAQAVTQFLQSQREFDVDKMWDSFSPELQAAILDRGASKDDLAQQLESEQAAGQRYSSIEYVGGVTIENNWQMFFYAVEIASSDPSRAGTFSYVFTVDNDGKIIRISM
jgi:hypothetical protein